MNAIRQIIAGELDARGLRRVPTDIAEKRRRAAAARWEKHRAQRDATHDAHAMQSAAPAKPHKTNGSKAHAMQMHMQIDANRDAAKQTWAAYEHAYTGRYGVPPVRNAKVNGMLSKFVHRVPAEEAPAIAQWFVSSDRGLYVSARHDVTLLLRDAEGLRTEWATKQSITESEARQKDATAGRVNVWSKLLAEVDERANARTPGDPDEP